MKKNFIITLVAILATSSIALADFNNFNPLSKLKVGRYVCNYQPQNRYSRSLSDKCIISIDKWGGISQQNCPTDSTESMKLVQDGKCTYSPDRNKYYTCKYPQGTCQVLVAPESGSYTGCSGTITDFDRVEADVKAGKCSQE